MLYQVASKAMNIDEIDAALSAEFSAACRRRLTLLREKEAIQRIVFDATGADSTLAEIRRLEKAVADAAR